MAYIHAVRWGRLSRGALGHERDDREAYIGWQWLGAGQFTEALLRIGVEDGHLRDESAITAARLAAIVVFLPPPSGSRPSDAGGVIQAWPHGQGFRSSDLPTWPARRQVPLTRMISGVEMNGPNARCDCFSDEVMSFLK